MNEPVTGLITELPMSGGACERRAKDLGHKSIKEFQAFYGLKVDGDPGPKTQRILFGRRFCAVPDHVRGPDAALCAWPQKLVSVWHDMIIDGAQASKAWESAIDAWNRACGIKMYGVDDKSKSNIYAHARRIDGGGGTLAWSYLPCGASEHTQLEQRYDTGESWSYDFLRRVIMHEIGHAIGFEHSPNQRSIMYAFSNGVDDLHQEDIDGAVKRYGPPDPAEPPPDDPDTPGTRWKFGTMTITCPHGDEVTVTPFETL